jgi:hypothetical protein
VRAMQCTQFRAKSAKNNLKPTDFIIRNFYFEMEEVCYCGCYTGLMDKVIIFCSLVLTHSNLHGYKKTTYLQRQPNCTFQCNFFLFFFLLLFCILNNKLLWAKRLKLQPNDESCESI